MEYPVPLSSSQSMASGLEKSPISAFKPGHSRSNSTGSSSRHSRQNSRDWEIVTDPLPSVGAPGHCVEKSGIPGICEGYLMKKRKYPLQGWHKVEFSDTQRLNRIGKVHGSMDVSLAVMSMNKKSRRIDLDAGQFNLYHIKAKSQEIFYIWLTKLTAHRKYKKNEAMIIHQDVLQALSAANSNLCSFPQLPQYQSSASICQPNFLDTPAASSSQVNSKVSAWLQQTQEASACQQELARCELDLADLCRLIQRLHWLEGDLPITNNDLERRISMQVFVLLLSQPHLFLFQLSASHLGTSSGLAASLQSIPDYVYTQLSTPGVTSPEGKKLQQEIYAVSQRLHASLKGVHETLSLERERLRQAWTGPDLRQATTDQLATLCTTLSEVTLKLNTHLFYGTVWVITLTLSKVCTVSPRTAVNMKYRASVSSAVDVSPTVPKNMGRRTVLPAHSADNSHIGILSILYNNIGKDLSRVSMPVALNEPVNFLQRVSEELEYSQLLDIANQIDDPYQRMVYVAVFSISGYAWASWRNRYKPFNPVLGETYESVREERGFRYVAEQVSHHPPVSACHAESENFTFWQDQRWKNKFWGKSVEIISTGMVNVTLPRYGDHYEWNKVVTCIHSVFSQQRWLEHYGDVVIKNLNSDECTCKMTFLKSHVVGGETIKNEVQGTVLDQAGNVVHRFGGSWHEGIFCDTLPEPQCIWKPNPQPDDYFDYYGFSSYARELNDLTPDLKPLLPPTDTRFRPDQRLLEEGKVSEADKKKDELEEKQRERRKELTKRGEEHIPRFFRKTVDEAGREVWVTNGTYWRIRENPGFANTPNLELW
uniref:Oxysterol-binding protein n=1 Tax=Astyanax mexicanus TaxID=7994 RepID=A0A8B9KNM4_ASTMX